jgi:hypothetical protein
MLVASLTFTVTSTREPRRLMIRRGPCQATAPDDIAAASLDIVNSGKTLLIVFFFFGAKAGHAHMRSVCSAKTRSVLGGSCCETFAKLWRD